MSRPPLLALSDQEKADQEEALLTLWRSDKAVDDFPVPRPALLAICDRSPDDWPGYPPGLQRICYNRLASLA